MALITQEDADALAHLVDVTCAYSDDFTTYTLSFHFSENEFFHNRVLTKRYVMVPSIFDESPGLAECEGCEINWKEGKNLTVKEVQKKQKAKNGKNKGQTRTVTKVVPKPSFFAFFKSFEEAAEAAQEESQEAPEGPQATLSIDQHYDIGHMIRVLVIPDAILLFTGEKEMVDIDYNVSV